MSLVGTKLGAHLLGDELGRGGMGTVYRAQTTSDSAAGPSGTPVAIKVFHPNLVQDERAFERFRLEAAIGKEIHHAHLVRTYGVGSATSEGTTYHFMVMELIEGRTLKQLREELGTVPEHLLYQIAGQVLDALHVIHQRGVVHRDIKPENIVITPDHKTLLMDLGVARRTAARGSSKAGEFVGSLAYAAPEQLSTSEVGPRADLYALGISLYELATGSNPYDGLDMTAIMQRKLNDELGAPRDHSPNLSAFGDQLIQTCVRRDASERFASAEELRRVLDEGESGDWWRQRMAGRTIPSAERALARLRLERRAPLIGREQEAERLHAVRARGTRDGAVVLLSGPSGVGKSRLLYDHLESIAGAHGPTVAAALALGGGDRGYAPFVEMLQDVLSPGGASEDARRSTLESAMAALLPEAAGLAISMAGFVLGTLQPGPDSGLSKDALHATIVDLLRALAQQRPLVLAIENLHLASAETADLFAYIATRVPGHAICLIGVFDNDELGAEAPARARIDELQADERVDRLDLRNLSPFHTEELVRFVVGHERTVSVITPTLQQRSEGNPLIVLSVLAHLSETGVLVEDDGGLTLAGNPDDVQIPSTVRDLVSLRLADLDEERREVLEAAAALGLTFDADLLAAVLEDESMDLLQTLAVLERKYGLVSSHGRAAFRFSSYQLYETIYEGITPALREEYHALIADVLLERAEEDVPGDNQAYEILRHLFLADRVLEAGPIVESALRYAAKNLSAGHAAPFLERVSQGLKGAAPRVRLAVAMQLWAFHEMRGRREDEMRVLELAGTLAAAAGDQEARARVHALRAGTFWYGGDYPSAADEAQAGLELAREAQSRMWEATCLHTLGVVDFRRGEVEHCAGRWREALRIRREIGDRRGEASTLQALSLVMRSIGEADRILETMLQALAIWREIGERRGEASMRMNVGNYFVDAGRHDEGLPYLERALEMHRDTGALMNEAIVLTNIGHAMNALGRIDDARISWERALGIFVEHGNPNGELAVRSMLGGALIDYGEFGEAKTHLTTAIELAERTGNGTKLALAHRTLGDLFFDAGMPEEGWEHLDRALQLDEEQGDASGRVLTLALRGKASLAAGDHVAATKALEAALPEARGIDELAPLILGHLARARRLAGDAAAARVLAQEALERFEQIHTPATRDGREVFYALHEVLGDPKLLTRGADLLRQRAQQVRNDSYREYFLTRAWPNRALLAASEGGAETTPP